MNRPKLEPNGFFGRIPLQPHQLTEELTRREDVIVLCHVGVPRIRREEWSLAIEGMVDRPATLRFDDLSDFDRHTVTTIHECAGSPLTPQEPKRRICNVKWSGVRVVEVLARCGVSASAKYLWSYGADYGEFAGVAIDRYWKDLPLARLSEDVLIATELNGEPLPPENGYPARLLVPGFYGTNSVKWLTNFTLADTRATGPFTTRWYNDVILDEAGKDSGERMPVWNIAPESVIVSPSSKQHVRAGEPFEIWGRAWGDMPISEVHVSVDGGANWSPADVSARTERSWQRFSIEWRPQRAGVYRLLSRAENSAGMQQPMTGRRNAVYRVEVEAV